MLVVDFSVVAHCRCAAGWRAGAEWKGDVQHTRRGLAQAVAGDVPRNVHRLSCSARAKLTDRARQPLPHTWARTHLPPCPVGTLAGLCLRVPPSPSAGAAPSPSSWPPPPLCERREGGMQLCKGECKGGPRLRHTSNCRPQMYEACVLCFRAAAVAAVEPCESKHKPGATHRRARSRSGGSCVGSRPGTPPAREAGGGREKGAFLAAVPTCRPASTCLAGVPLLAAATAAATRPSQRAQSHTRLLCSGKEQPRQLHGPTGNITLQAARIQAAQHAHVAGHAHWELAAHTNDLGDRLVGRALVLCGSAGKHGVWAGWQVGGAGGRAGA